MREFPFRKFVCLWKWRVPWVVRVHHSPGGQVTRTLSISFNDVDFPGLKTCVDVSSQPSGSKRSSGCGVGSPLDFVMQFSEVEDISVDIAVLAADQIEGAPPSLSQRLNVRCVRLCVFAHRLCTHRVCS